MADDGTESEDLKQIWELFSGVDDDIKEKRQKITQMVHENNVSSWPNELTVMESLDAVMGCFSLGGQLKHYYRYGTYSPCERERKKFWFAVRNGSFYNSNKSIEELTPKDIEKRQKIQNFYKQQTLENKARGSSEDIWDERESLLANPFKGYKKGE